MNQLKNKLYPAYKIFRKYPLWKKYLKWHIYSRWLPNKIFEANLGDTELRITLAAMDALAASIFWNGRSEPVFFDFMNKHLKSGMIVFDIGANIGQYTLLAAKQVGENGQVHSFEPADREFSLLQRSIKNNGLNNITLQKKAVSDFDGYSLLNVFPDGQGAYNTLGKPSHNVIAHAETRVKEVECIQIDSYISMSKIDAVDLIKIDVEGGEINVLKGATSLLSRDDAPLIMCEFGDETLAGFGHQGIDLHKYFESLGYLITESTGERGQLVPVEHQSRYGANYIAIKPTMLSKWGLTLKYEQLDWKAPEGLFQDRTNVKSVFNTIYEKSVWGKGSGGGSNFQNARPYCEYLQKFLAEHKIKSVIDYGCGDWRMSEHINWNNIRYLGIDIVSNLVEHNAKKYGQENIKFMCADILDSEFSLPHADLFILKDVLQHLSNENVIKILSIATQYPYVLITNDYSSKNLDCKNGDTRPLDIRKKPFHLKQAKEVLVYKHKRSFLIQPSNLVQD